MEAGEIFLTINRPQQQRVGKNPTRPLIFLLRVRSENYGSGEIHTGCKLTCNLTSDGVRFLSPESGVRVALLLPLKPYPTAHFPNLISKKISLQKKTGWGTQSHGQDRVLLFCKVDATPRPFAWSPSHNGMDLGGFGEGYMGMKNDRRSQRKNRAGIHTCKQIRGKLRGL